MARLKIDYGIDLGTTNSAICRMDKGEISIIKSDTLKDTMPSCVSINKKQNIRVGDAAYNDMKSDKRRATKSWKASSSNTFIEFKRKMGTDEIFQSSYLGKDLKPEELSAEVLKTLKSFVTDETINAVVVTVPAMFKINQKDATMRAAKMAGFNHCELLQEPIAAAMAYGLSADQKDGLWLVFDFGGGTFDAALLRVEDGIMQVFDTEGDNYLGGKNLDYAIVDKIIIPYLQENYAIDAILADDNKRMILRDAMKTYAEDAKNQLSFKEKEDIISNLGDLGEDDEGNEIELDLSINQETLKTIFAPIFQTAIDITKKLLERNNLEGSQLDKIILVGGPTHSPILREMLKEQICENVDTSIDPMTAVAKGAALYASTIDSEVKNEVEVGTVALKLDYESTTVESVEYININIDRAACVGGIPDNLMAEFVRADKAWSSGKFALTDSIDVIECSLNEGRPNSFSINVYDEQGNSIPCTPDSITIIQGSKVGSAILPYNIGIEVWDDVKHRAVFSAIKGLEKSKTLPATGVRNGLKTTVEIRPGLDTDMMKIPIYQAEAVKQDEKLPAACFEFVYEARLTGENLPALLPAGSDVDLTIKCDRSEQITLSVYIPALNHSEDILVPRNTVQKTVSDAYLKEEIDKAREQVRKLRREGCDVTEVTEGLFQVEEELNNGDEKGQVLKHLRDQLQNIARMDNSGEWERMEKKLRGALKMLVEDNEKYGNDQTKKQVASIKKQVEIAINKKDLIMGKELLDVMHALNFQIATIEYYAAWISDWDERFDKIDWDDRSEARRLVDRGKQMLASGRFSAETLQPIIQDLIELLPKSEMPTGPGGLLK